ncbi:hypothetical protein KJI95_09450 [Shewanella sp. JM162201]|uniref:KfrA N-terminal DNA-binding domain-containing protein n=1 Tax=Shewanella jiangmenensis TaxID=2837387 RepID=A0ABS5V2R7_9GAMM|nr:hypothetical protein [Shewanella jiangmenensis]MBT1444745.1 hypothetical protein [Shewanella jiangmenensis]
MSQIEQVLFTAAQLEAKGQEPSIALIKANLPSPLPMPVIVKGLQHFKNLSSDDKAKLAPPQAAAPKPEQAACELTELRQRVAALEALCQALVTRIDNLEQGPN